MLKRTIHQIDTSAQCTNIFNGTCVKEGNALDYLIIQYLLTLLIASLSPYDVLVSKLNKTVGQQFTMVKRAGIA